MSVVALLVVDWKAKRQSQSFSVRKYGTRGAYDHAFETLLEWGWNGQGQITPFEEIEQKVFDVRHKYTQMKTRSVNDEQINKL